MSGTTLITPAIVPHSSLIDSEVRFQAKERLSVRFARTTEEVEAALKLRYEVFNLELGEGLASAFRTGCERDEFDSDSEHLIIVDSSQRRIVGTCRLRTYEIAKTTNGFCSSRQFDLSALPPEILANAVEISRVCIAKTHRNSEAKVLLLNGLVLSLLQHKKRYLFGALSLSTQNPTQAGRLFDQLNREGQLHPQIRMAPRPGCKCFWYRIPVESSSEIAVSSWIRISFHFGAKLCGYPALNRQFKTIDLPFFLDGKHLEEIRGQV
jgi:putative hemolysin